MLRIFLWILSSTLVFSETVFAQTKQPKGCYEKIYSKSELKQLPLQKVTALRISSNTAKQPEHKPASYGTLQARFRDSGDVWLSTAFECSDTGTGFACATMCDASVFMITLGAAGLQLMPPKPINMFAPDCADEPVKLRMNADAKPFLLTRRGPKACPKD
jgi:hypothetical protein